MLGLVVVLIVGLVLPVCGSVILTSAAPDLEWSHIPFHSVAEAAGGIIALVMAALMAYRSRGRLRESEDRWIAAALAGMGVLDIAHAAVDPGPLFVWFHSSATLVGGVVFAGVWLPMSGKQGRHLALWVFGLASAFVTASLYAPSMVPTMAVGGEFTPLARALNGVGGVGFYAAAVYFALRFRSTKAWDELFFATHCTLFGSAGVLFEMSTLWDGPWWWWHLLRLAAYAVAIGYLGTEMVRWDSRLTELNDELDFANQTLEERVRLRTSELDQANSLLKAEMGSRQRLEEERWMTRLRQSQKLESLGVLAGGIAHDFNNLLAGVVGNVDLVLNETTEPSVRHAAKRIERAGQRAANLTRQLLAYSGKGQFVVDTLELNEELREMTELLTTSTTPRHTLEWRLTDEPLHVEVDRTQLQQVVMNLLTNAADAIDGPTGTITLRTGALTADASYFSTAAVGNDLGSGEYVFVEVQDNGNGMDLLTQDRMFDPFFTTKESGRGLGLSATLGIVRGHNGALRVASAPGRGTRMRLILPAVDAPPISSPEAPRIAWEGQGLILVIDDEPELRELLSEALPMLGFDVITAEDGATGLQRFQEHIDNVQAVILDLTMPGMTGEDVYAELRKLHANPRVLFSSGYSEFSTKVRFGDESTVGFLQKPYRLTTLREKLEELFAEDTPIE